MTEGGKITVSASSAIGDLRNPIIRDDTGVLIAPDNIITSVSSLKSIYFQYRGEHLKRIELYAGIEGLMSGNPPYDQAELDAARLSHITNINNLDARSKYEDEANAYWNLLNEAETLVEFEIRPSHIFAGAEPDQLDEWGEIMARHWDGVVRSWGSFNVAFNTLVAQIVKFGISPAMWPDERDWRWRTIESSRFFIPDQAQSDMDQLTCVCVETIVTAQYLWEVYAKGKKLSAAAQEKFPWNMNELERLLLQLANNAVKDAASIVDIMDLQRRFQNGDSTLNAIFSDEIRLVSTLYKEYTGEFSHYMFHPYYDAGEFLYMASKQYQCLQEGLVLFTASPGETTIHSNRGLGHKIYAPSQATMQLDCTIIDMAKMSATPLIKTTATGTKDFDQIRFYTGVPTSLGSAEFVENTLGENIQQVVGAAQYIDRKIDNNMMIAGDDPGTPDRDTGSKSAPEARMQSYREFGIPKTNINHFYTGFDKVVESMTIKLWNSKKGYPGYEFAYEWKARCLEDGVPEVMFKQKKTDMYGMPAHVKVKATRVAGDGSTLAKLLGLQEIQDLIPTFGPNEQLYYKKQKVLAALGPRFVKGFTQDSLNTASISEDASIAGVENAVMRAGESPIFSPANEHRAHMVTHMALGNDTIRRIQQQQMDPVQADKIFTVLIPHMQQHWQRLVNNPFAASIASQLKKPWDQVQKYAELNRHNAAKILQGQIKKQQEMAQKQNAQMSDQALKAQQTQANIANANAKTAAGNQRAIQASHDRASIMRTDVQNKADNERLKIQLEAENKKSLTGQTGGVESASQQLEQTRQALANINGVTPAPFDIETPS